MLGISPEKVCFIVLKARQFDAKVPPVEPDPGSNPMDKGFREVLEDYPDDPVARELSAAIRELNADELTDLLALAFVGRGDFDAEGWDDAQAAAEEDPDRRTVRWLLGQPLLSDQLEEGLRLMGYSCDDLEAGHL